jgi:protein tyrosine phosphatase (PTP) superfamily phosphohydrolase (DUF442 family)
MNTSSLEEITNFLPISERIGSGGQPTPEQFEQIWQAGYQVVVNLALPTSTNALPQEGALVAGLGMIYVNIPVIWEAPTLDDFERFLAVMQAFQDKKVFVHCALNMRVSAFVYLYRLLVLGDPPQAAAADLQQIWQPDTRWQDFIQTVLELHTSSPSKENP